MPQVLEVRAEERVNPFVLTAELIGEAQIGFKRFRPSVGPLSDLVRQLRHFQQPVSVRSCVATSYLREDIGS